MATNISLVKEIDFHLADPGVIYCYGPYNSSVVSETASGQNAPELQKSNFGSGECLA